MLAKALYSILTSASRDELNSALRHVALQSPLHSVCICQATISNAGSTESDPLAASAPSFNGLGVYFTSLLDNKCFAFITFELFIDSIDYSPLIMDKIWDVHLFGVSV